MFRNYLLISIRNLLKHKGFSLLNIVGLALGMSVFLLIAHYVKFERSYETFLPDSEQIYRLTLERYQSGEQIIASAENVPGAGPAITNAFPEVLDYARLYNMGYKNNLIITNEQAQPEPIAFKHRHFLYADASFLSMMGYEMVAGDPSTVLTEPLTAVISEEYAIKYFGKENPIGKELRMQDDDFNDERVQVMGVFKDLPKNTHLHFDVLFSYATLYGRGDWAQERYNTTWGRNDMYTFLKLKAGTNPDFLEAKFPEIVKQNNPELAEMNGEDILKLQAIQDIHLTSDLGEEPTTNGDESIVFFMSVIGLLVLIIAWINYINLSTARAMERAKEVGIRKVSGAMKGQLIAQFLIESAIVNFLSFVFAFMIAASSLSWFNELTSMGLTLMDLFSSWSLLMAFAIWLVGTILSGLYPAWVLSAFKPVTVLKGQFKNTGQGLMLRKGLVIVQFAASVALIAGTFVIYQQINHMMNQDIGMDIEQVLVVERPGISPRDRTARNAAVDVFRAKVGENGNVQGVATSLTIPGKQREFKAPMHKYGAPEDQAITIRYNSMDYNFIDVFDMELLAGRAFSESFPNDPDTSIIVTLSTAKLLGYQTPEDIIGQTMTMPWFRWSPIVVGVVNDYHQVSLKKAVDPVVFFCGTHSGEFYSMKVKMNDLPGTISHVKSSWDTAFPGNPFAYFFLDDYFDAQYKNEQRFGNLAGVFALLAIFVGCLGLFGLAGYTIIQRTKEIGVRKVLGATTTGLVFLLSKDILKLVLISIFIATPLAWLTMDNWLQDFAYRVDLKWWIFIGAGLLAVLIAFLTVSFQSVRAALANPIESLRSE